MHYAEEGQHKKKAIHTAVKLAWTFFNEIWAVFAILTKVKGPIKIQFIWRESLSKHCRFRSDCSGSTFFLSFHLSFRHFQILETSSFIF